jgi:hypothetical protein
MLMLHIADALRWVFGSGTALKVLYTLSEMGLVEIGCMYDLLSQCRNNMKLILFFIRLSFLKKMYICSS